MAARFPNTNQTKHWYDYVLRYTRVRVLMSCHSFQNYTDYFKCVAAKGEDYAPCKQFKRAYNSLCPSECYGSCTNGYGASVCVNIPPLSVPQIARFDDQRENGTFPASLEP
ncbi:COX6B, subunit VIb of cytochrome c oxidase [Boletus reticuloceps]|uniref:COX6B, subunit VIb of cytochrome c oxidase n=1 Tax=Boletus reticuloceps TaxID=495285 RepID=A0A8I2YEU4_9AGAM|nr:COX6B, subunit VIb of cytochrome c oxidase [Boletus reticuloceps]